MKLSPHDPIQHSGFSHRQRMGKWESDDLQSQLCKDRSREKTGTNKKLHRMSNCGESIGKEKGQDESELQVSRGRFDERQAEEAGRDERQRAKADWGS